MSGRVTLPKPDGFRWAAGTELRKKSGAAWSGKVVGFYSSSLTPEGYAIESDKHPGSVQIYPLSALEHDDDNAI